MSFASYIKSLEALLRAIKPLAQNTDMSDMEREAALDKALSAAKVLDVNAIVVELQSQIDTAKHTLETALTRRREELHIAAKVNGVPNKRFSEYDFIGPFKISFKGRKVQIDVGSERVAEIQEPDGARLFEIIKARE